MTREEAINELKRHQNEFAHDHGWNYSVLEALHMAIEALQTEQLKESPENFNKDSETESMLNADLISRQAVNNLRRYRYSCGDTYVVCVSLNDIQNLPSVQPEQKVIKCKDCNEWHRGKNHDGSDIYSDEGYCPVHRTITGEDYYCGDAERR